MALQKRDLIEDLQGRLPSYAMHAKLQSLIFKKSMSLAKYGFEQPDEQSTFVFLIMNYLMQRTLESSQGEGCTIDELAWKILSLLKEQYGRVYSQEDAKSLARLILIEILGNNGEPVVFAGGGRDFNEPIGLNFLSSEMGNEGGSKVPVYNLSQTGLHYMVSTREMEENMKIEVNTLILDLSMKARDYVGAVQTIRQQIDLLRIKELEIQEYIAQTKSDVLSMSAAQAFDLYEENFSLISRSRDKFEAVRRNANAEIQEAKMKLQANLLDESLQKQLDLLQTIDAMLQSSILAMGQVLNVLQNFQQARHDAYFVQMGSSILQRHFFKRDLFDPVMKDGNQLETAAGLIHSLFLNEPGKTFGLEDVLDIKVQMKQEEEVQDADFELDEEEEWQLKRQRRLENVRKMDEVTFALTKKLLHTPDHSVSLSEFIPNTQTFALLDLQSAKELLASWSFIAKIDLDSIRKQIGQMDDFSDEIYSLPLSIMRAHSRYKELEEYAFLSVEKNGDQTFVSQPMDDMYHRLSMDDINLRLIRKVLL